MTVDLKAHFLKALEFDPEFSDAHLQLGIIYQNERDLKNAIIHYKSAIDSDVKLAESLETRGEELLKKGQFQNAKDLFMKAQEKKNHSAEASFHLAGLYENENNLQDAQLYLEKSIEQNPTANAHRDLGILLSRQNQIDSSRLHIEKALNLNYADPLSHLHLGLLMQQAQENSEAEQEFLSALDINPEYVDCMVELAALKLKMNQRTEAEKYYLKAKEISPQIQHSALDKAIG